jgi:uncharacterized protein YejL (UPF0352 family)
MRRLALFLSGRFPISVYFLLFVSILFIGTIIFWLVNVLASIGTTLILIGDYFATAFTVVGIKEPALGWLLLGYLLGGTIGFIQGLKRTGRSSETYLVYLVAAAVFLGLQTVAHSQWQLQFDTTAFQEIALQEDFAPAKNWTLPEGAMIKDGGLFQLQPHVNWADWSSWEGQTFSDVDFSTDVIKVDGPDNVFFGILARVSGGENPNFYYLRINGNGYLTMGKYSQNHWDNIVDSKEIDFLNKGNNKNHLRLVCNGNLITGFINDQVVGRFRDTSYKSGKIAVQSARGEENAVAVYFDNVLVKEKLDSNAAKR